MEIDRVRDEVLSAVRELKEDMRQGFRDITSRFDGVSERVIALEKHQAADYVRLKELYEIRVPSLDHRVGDLSSRMQAVEDESGSRREGTAKRRREQAVTLTIGGGAGALLLKLLEALFSR